MGDDSTVALGALRVDEGKLKGHVNEVVRSSVEATLNGLLEAEADRCVGRSAMSVRRIGSTPVAARLRHIAATKWGKRRYLVMETLLNPAKQEAAA